MTDHIKKLADARAKIKAQAEEIERLKDSSWLYASMEEKNHNLKLLYDKSNRQEAELAALREQVRTLRRAVIAYDLAIQAAAAQGKSWVEDGKLDELYEAMMAATEPKG